MGATGILGAAAPLLARSQARPCPPPQISAGEFGNATTACTSSNVPAYIASLAPFEVRSLSGNYSPDNGTTTLRSVMPSMWAGNDDIIRPWSGGPKSLAGTKMYVHGGGHGDSSNNGLYSFDFAGASRPTGWAIEYAGVPNTSSSFPIGSVGAPVAVHTYDGMIDMGADIYRIGGAVWPSGHLTPDLLRYSKATGEWTRLADYPDTGGAGMALGEASAGKLLFLEREGKYFAYAFYRMGSNSWSTRKTVGSQWNNNGGAAWSPSLKIAVTIGSNGYGTNMFSVGIDWSGETITQTARSAPNVGGGSAVMWDATLGRFWAFGGAGNNSTIYEINPSSWAVTAHPLSGDSISPETPYMGAFGRWVFMEDWRAIGSVASRNGAAYIIRLP